MIMRVKGITRNPLSRKQQRPTSFSTTILLTGLIVALPGECKKGWCAAFGHSEMPRQHLKYQSESHRQRLERLFSIACAIN